jgi:hypothetical protein
MLNAQSQWRIIVLTAADVPVGELTSATTLNTSDTLDMVGQVTFDAPAADPLMAQINAGSRFDIYSRNEGYLGRYVYANSMLNDSIGSASRSITAWSVLIDLTRDTVGFKRKYSDHPLAQIAADVAAIGGWSTEVESGLGSLSIAFEGNSPLDALTELVKRSTAHFRIKQGSTNVVQFGVFGVNSGGRLMQLDAHLMPLMQVDRVTGIIERASWRQNADAIYNRVIAVGSGQGEAQITMASADTGTLGSAANQDGSLYYFVEDTDSQHDYGRRTHVLTLNTTRPTENSLTGLVAAANTLKAAAESFLSQHKDPQNIYTFTVRRLPAWIQVGDLIYVQYRGVTEDVTYLDVEGYFYVTDLMRQRTANGDDVAQITVSDLERRELTDQELQIELVREVHALKTAIQPTATTFQFSGSDFVDSTGFDANFYFTIGDEITSITRITLTFQAFRMKGNLNQVDAASARSFWLVTQAQRNLYPDGLKLLIDGVDVTTAQGGPFRWVEPGDYAAPGMDIALDITDDIRNSPLGVYAQHTITLQIDTSYAWVDFLDVSGAAPVQSGDANKGEILFNVRVVSATQAI